MTRMSLISLSSVSFFCVECCAQSLMLGIYQTHISLEICGLDKLASFHYSCKDKHTRKACCGERATSIPDRPLIRTGSFPVLLERHNTKTPLCKLVPSAAATTCLTQRRTRESYLVDLCRSLLEVLPLIQIHRQNILRISSIRHTQCPKQAN